MSKSEIKIRQMKEKDLKKLAELYVKAYKIYNKWERWNTKAAYRLFKYWLKRQPDLALVAEYNNKVAGAFVAGIKPWWDGNHLIDGELVVDPDYQKKGIGKLLLKTMLEKAILKYNATMWDAITFKKTEFPLSWYRRLGFNEADGWTIISGNIKKALEKAKKEQNK